MINRPEIPQIAFLQAGSLDDRRSFQPVAEEFACRADLLIGSFEGVRQADEGASIEFLRDIVAAHFATRH